MSCRSCFRHCRSSVIAYVKGPMYGLHISWTELLAVMHEVVPLML